MDESKYINIGGSSNLASVANLLVLLNNNLGELVKAEKEKNDILRGIKNKLSDIAVINATSADSSGERYNAILADSEEESGLHFKYTKKKGKSGYYYYNDNVKQKEDDTDEQHS